MRKYLYISALAISVLATPVAGMASDVTYTVDEAVGSGSVTGSITTDGAIGMLATSDIVDWSLTLNDGTATFLLEGPGGLNNSQVADEFGDLSASATQLVYDYGNSDGGMLLFEYPTLGSDGPFLCYTSSPWCSLDSSTGVSLSTQDGEALTIDTALSGPGVIGSVAGVAQDRIDVAPEPSSLLLLGSGMVGLISVARRRVFADAA